MRRAQIQIGETIVVLFVFIILIVIGLVVYVGFEKSKLRQKSEEQIGLSASEIAQRAMYLPEISCSNDNIPVYNCFDRVKLENSTKIIRTETADIYWYMFLWSNITVELVYPYQPRIYTLYSRVPDSWSSRLYTVIPVTVYEPLAEKGNEYMFGLLKVEVFSQ